jgi:hypothetical protein
MSVKEEKLSDKGFDSMEANSHTNDCIVSRILRNCIIAPQLIHLPAEVVQAPVTLPNFV